jgi:hypothetical protein
MLGREASRQFGNKKKQYRKLTSLQHGKNRNIVLFFNWYSGGGVQLGPLGTAATNRPIVPAPGDYDDGDIGGMIGRGNRSTRRKSAPVPLCPPQTPDANPGHRGGKPATNRLSCGTAEHCTYIVE